MRKLVKMTGLTVFLPIILLLAGCAPSAMQFAPLPEHLNAAPAPGQARICVIRGYIFWIGAAVENHIQEDGMPRGNLINGSYICWERPPGVAKLTMGGYLDTPDYRGNLPVEADMIYYLYMDAMSPQLTSIPPAEAQRYLAEYPKPTIPPSLAHPPTTYGQAPPGGAGAQQPSAAPGGGPALPSSRRVGY